MPARLLRTCLVVVVGQPLRSLRMPLLHRSLAPFRLMVAWAGIMAHRVVPTALRDQVRYPTGDRLLACGGR